MQYWHRIPTPHLHLPDHFLITHFSNGNGGEARKEEKRSEEKTLGLMNLFLVVWPALKNPQKILFLSNPPEPPRLTRPATRETQRATQPKQSNNPTIQNAIGTILTLVCLTPRSPTHSFLLDLYVDVDVDD
jgi:hypothetical protein